MSLNLDLFELLAIIVVAANFISLTFNQLSALLLECKKASKHAAMPFEVIFFSPRPLVLLRRVTSIAPGRPFAELSEAVSAGQSQLAQLVMPWSTILLLGGRDV